MIKTLFCEKCHRLVTQVDVTEKGVQVVKDGHRVGAVMKGNKTIDKDGKEHNGFPFPCGHGHTVYIGDS